MNSLSEEIKNVEKPSLFGMILNPTEQFERIKERPLIWGAMAIVTILTMFGTWLMSLGIEMPEEVKEMPGLEAVTQIGMVIVGLFTPILTVLISSFISWIIIKIARSEATFTQLFSMNTYIMLISALSLLFNGLLTPLLSGDGEIMFTSLGSLLSAEGAIAGLFDSLEVFTIWGVILSAIGLHKVGELSKGLAWTISIGFFIIGIILSMIGAAISAPLGV